MSHRLSRSLLTASLLVLHASLLRADVIVDSFTDGNFVSENWSATWVGEPGASNPGRGMGLRTSNSFGAAIPNVSDKTASVQALSGNNYYRFDPGAGNGITPSTFGATAPERRIHTLTLNVRRTTGYDFNSSGERYLRFTCFTVTDAAPTNAVWGISIVQNDGGGFTGPHLSAGPFISSVLGIPTINATPRTYVYDFRDTTLFATDPVYSVIFGGRPAITDWTNIAAFQFGWRRIGAPAAASNMHGGFGMDDVVLSAQLPGISAGSPTASVNESGAGNSTNVSYVLDAIPTGDVRIDFTLAGAPVQSTLSTALGQHLIFTTANWNTPQDVTITAVDDAAVEGDLVYDLTGIISGDDPLYSGTIANNLPAAITVPAVSVTIVDDDFAGLVVTGDPLVVPEGGSASYSVSLSGDPGGSVTVSATAGAGDADLTSSSVISFDSGNFSMPQNLVVDAAEDADATDGARSFTINASGALTDSQPVTANEDDNDLALSITPSTPLDSTGFFGGPFVPTSQVYTLTNIGGASLDWTAGDDQTWIDTGNPGGTLGIGASTDVTISLNAGINSLAPGVQGGLATFTDTTAGQSQTRAVQVTVGDSLSVTPTSPFTATAFGGGPVTPECRTYTITNNTASSVNWSTSTAENWLSFSTPNGTLGAGASTTVDVCITDVANCLTAGVQPGTATITDSTNSFNFPRPVSLTMSSERDCNSNGIADSVDIAPGVAVAQDNCFDAQFATTAVSYTGTTVGATNDGTSTCGTSATTADMWLAYRPSSNGTLTITSCNPGSDYDTVLAVFSGTCPGTGELACNDDDTCGFSGQRSTASTAVVAGTDYLIRITGHDGATGNFEVTLSGPAGTNLPPSSSADVNFNGIPDECEAVADTDSDGKPDLCEKTLTGDLVGGFYTNALLRDSDGDGLTDGEENPCDCYSIVTILAQSNPRMWDTDSDGWGDGLEVQNPAIFPNGPLVSDTALPDADNDGLPDDMDPDDANADADGDLFADVYEQVHGSSLISGASTPTTGDVNNDATVDVADVAMSADANLDLLSMTAPWNSDLTLDGIIDLVDVATLADFNLGLITVGP